MGDAFAILQDCLSLEPRLIWLGAMPAAAGDEASHRYYFTVHAKDMVPVCLNLGQSEVGRLSIVHTARPSTVTGGAGPHPLPWAPLPIFLAGARTLSRNSKVVPPPGARRGERGWRHW